eukprot:1539943-Prymnesium_polylepis.1
MVYPENTVGSERCSIRTTRTDRALAVHSDRDPPLCDCLSRSFYPQQQKYRALHDIAADKVEQVGRRMAVVLPLTQSAGIQFFDIS